MVYVLFYSCSIRLVLSETFSYLNSHTMGPKFFLKTYYKSYYIYHNLFSKVQELIDKSETVLARVPWMPGTHGISEVHFQEMWMLRFTAQSNGTHGL